VINRAIFPDNKASHALFVPPGVVSESEKSQMEARIPDFLDSLMALDLKLEPLRRQISKPLRSLWVTQEDVLSSDPVKPVAQHFHPVVCCTSSRRVAGTEISEGGYIQGAGDDTENWALGLTAPIFWGHMDELLSTPEAVLPDLIQSLLESPEPEGEGTSEVKELTPHLFVGTLSALKPSLTSGTCVVTLGPKSTDPSSWLQSTFHLDVGLGKSKAASRSLRQALPEICDFVSKYLARPALDAEAQSEKRVVILCETGRDLSVGVALALSCWCFGAAGNIRANDSRETFSKTTIRIRLGQIMTAMSYANPSRSTLQSVNSFLMDWRN